MKNYRPFCLKIFFIFCFVQNIYVYNTLASEPIVVLEYSSSKLSGQGLNNSNNFILNPNFSTKHQVQEDETLGHILYAYYGKSGLNLRIVEMAIVEFNPKSFRNRNPNFLFANQSIHLPSLNEMKDLVLGKTKNQNKTQSNNTSSHIYFFGG